MKILGIEIPWFREKAAVPAVLSSPMTSSPGGGGWYPIVRESFTGAWQRGVTVDRNNVLSDVTIFRCTTLIANDCSKLRIKLVSRDRSGLWQEAESAAFSPVLRKPNPFQTRQQFVESWVLAKLIHGNTYVLKERDARGVVVRLYPLDPLRVKVLVSDAGDIFYDLKADNIAGIGDFIAPASEIIHDRWNTLFHPLVGVSPLFAAGLAATGAQALRNHSAAFFANQAMPSGLLIAPGNISDENAARLKESWETRFTGANAGKIAVLGDDLKYQQLAMAAEAAQLVEQAKMSREDIATAFGVPLHKIGGPLPTGAVNVEAMEASYYSQIVQVLLEAMEACLDEGLALPSNYGTEFDLDGLMRMDTPSLVTSLKDAVGAGIMAPNEARRKLDLAPVTGGDSPLVQQQNYSLEALAARDAGPDPFGTGAPPAEKSVADDRLYPALYRGDEIGKRAWRELVAAGAAGGPKPRVRAQAGSYIRKVIEPAHEAAEKPRLRMPAGSYVTKVITA